MVEGRCPLTFGLVLNLAKRPQHEYGMNDKIATKPTSIILYGGKERRFGRSKATASVGGQMVIERILAVLEPLSSKIVAVTSPEKPDVPVMGKATIVTDSFPGKGPLGGIYTGLQNTEGDLAIVVGCDMPFLNAALLTRMVEMAEGYDAVVPRLAGEMVEPLHAVYARSCLPEMRARLERGELSITQLLKQLHVRYMEKEEYLPFDPRMLSFFNINYPDDLERANRIAAGIED
jgi:molybdopterin-guanine dinucleotide biosynthesis protein A